MADPYLTASFGWCMISSIVYIAVLYTLRKHRKKPPFDSSYFELFLYAGYLDLAIVVYVTTYVKIPMFGIFPGPHMLAYPDGMVTKVGGITAWMCLDCQQQFIVVTALNRYTAICMPTRYAQVWTSTFVKIASAGCLVATGLIHAVQWTYEIRSGRSAATGGVEMFHIDKEQRAFTYAFGGIRFFSYSFVTLVMYVSVVVTFMRKKAAGTSGRSKADVKADNREARLAMCGMVVFACQQFLVAYMFLVVVLKTNRGVVKYLYYIGGDILTTVNPYALLALSKTTRNLTLFTIGVKNKPSVTSVTPATTPGAPGTAAVARRLTIK